MMNDNFFGRLADLIVKPARLMENVGARPSWWQPGLLIMILTVGFTYLITPISKPESVEMMRDSKIMEMAPEGTWQKAYDDALNVSQTQILVESGFTGFGTWLAVIVFSLILGFFAKMSGGTATMKQALGVGSWAAVIPFGLGLVVKLPLILVTESVFEVNLGLAALLPDADPSSAIYKVLANYGDLMTWWGLIVMIVGFMVVGKMSKNAASVSVILPWALLTAPLVIFAIIFA
jgi:hypothetical protein